MPLTRFLSVVTMTGALFATPAAWAQTPSPHTVAPAPVPAVPPPSNATRGGTTSGGGGLPALSTTSPAPVSSLPPEQVIPSDRVPGAGPNGQSHASGPADGTPFSSGPELNQPSDDEAGPHSRVYPGAGTAESPNLSK